jgi:hypothetical protein
MSPTIVLDIQFRRKTVLTIENLTVVDIGYALFAGPRELGKT